MISGHLGRIEAIEDLRAIKWGADEIVWGLLSQRTRRVRQALSATWARRRDKLGARQVGRGGCDARGARTTFPITISVERGIGGGGIDAASARAAVAKRGVISRVGRGGGASLERGRAPLAMQLVVGVVLDAEIVVMVTPLK